MRLGALALSLIFVAATIGCHAKAQITGTNLQTKHPSDGSAALSYSHASQCPAGTDVVFWPSVNQPPNFPKSISVCVVENRAVKKEGR